MAKVFITGGLGFIGSHLVDAHLQAGDSVVVLDSGVAAVAESGEYEDHPRCEVILQSLEDFFESGGSLEGVDRVVHAASHVGPAGILKYAGHLGHEIVRGTGNVIEACIAADVPLCVFSSAEVYGRSGALGENDDLLVPAEYSVRIEYAGAKTLTEIMTVNSLQRGLEAFVIRPFNVVGPRQSRAGGFVLPTFVQQALAGEPITVFASGQQVRSLTAVSDLSRFLTGYWGTAIRSGRQIFNVGNPANRTTILKLAIRVRELLGSNSEIVYVDGKDVYGPAYVEAHSFEKVPVLDAAPNIGWSPQVHLDELILDTAEYYSSRGDYRMSREARETAADAF